MGKDEDGYQVIFSFANISFVVFCFCIFYLSFLKMGTDDGSEKCRHTTI